MMGRGGIFDDGPGFGGSFGNDMRMQSQRNPNMGRDQMQVSLHFARTAKLISIGSFHLE